MNSSRGRPAGGSDARERLVTAARELFLREGYATVSARRIAREADVDHTLVNYYFGSKHGLLGEVMALAFNPATVLDTVLADPSLRDPLRLAERLLAELLAVWEEPGLRRQVLAVVRQAVTDDGVPLPFGEFLGTEIIGRLAAHIGGRDATRRASGVSTAIAGVMFSRYLMRIEPMASMSSRDVVRTMAPMLAVHLR